MIMQGNNKDKTVEMHLYLTPHLLAPKLLSKSCMLRLPNYVELVSKYNPQRGSIDHMTPHRLDQNHSNHPTPYHLVRRGSQTTCNCKHDYHDSCTLCKGKRPVPMSSDFIAS
jgi:hypothetical protein